MADGDTISGLVAGFKAARKKTSPGDLAKIYAAFESLTSLPVPRCYIDGLRDELLQTLCLGRAVAPTYVYLSFYGVDERASYLKIGIARNVRARMGGIATGNPLPRLWTFAASYPTREDASRVESGLLAHTSSEKVHGEWIRVAGLSEQAAKALVDSLAEVAEEVIGIPVQWHSGGF